MNRTTLNNPDGSMRAALFVYGSGKRVICLPSGTPMGFYNPTSKTTHTMCGTLVGFGDLLASLV
jgi:hypothetical protein